MLGIGSSLSKKSYKWKPTQVGADLKLWLRNGVGVAVTQWDDSSGNENHVRQSTGGNQGVVSDGGLDFEANDETHYDFTSQIAIGSREGFMIFLVCKLESTSANQTILSLNSTDHFLEFKGGADEVRVKLAGATTRVIPGDGTQNDFSAGSKMIVSLQREAGATGNLNVFKNGSELAQDSQAANDGDAEFSALGVRNSDRFFDGVVYELLVYDTIDLTEEEINKIHDYLKLNHEI